MTNFIAQRKIQRQAQVNILNQPIDSRYLLIFIAVATIFCILFYLWQINGLATRGYKIRDLDQSISDLKDQNKKLELQVADLRSSARIAEKVKELNLVEVARIEYLIGNGSSVAVNR